MTNKIGKKVGNVQPSPSSQPASRQVDNCNNILSEGCANMQKDFERQEQKEKIN